MALNFPLIAKIRQIDILSLYYNCLCGSRMRLAHPVWISAPAPLDRPLASAVQGDIGAGWDGAGLSFPPQHWEGRVSVAVLATNRPDGFGVARLQDRKSVA